MKEYHKIETPFERDVNGTKKLIIGQFRNKAVEFLKDCQWSWTEKIDGTNIRIIWDGHRVSFRGRTDAAQLHPSLLDKLNEYFGGPTNEEMFEQLFGEKEIVLYGEGYGDKIQAAGKKYLPDSVDFILFDVRCYDRYWDRSCVDGIAKSFGCRSIPVVFTGTLQEAIDYVKTQPKSLIANDKDLIMEGLVGTPVVPLLDNSGGRIITKVKVVDFEE